MSLYRQFKTNKDKEKSGVWVEYGVNDDGTVAKFKISRMGQSNKTHSKLITKKFKPHRKSLELETINMDLAEKLMMEAFVEGILLGWDNIADSAGVYMDFNKENAMKLFTDLPELYQDLQEQAKKVTLFRDAQLEEDAGN